MNQRRTIINALIPDKVFQKYQPLSRSSEDEFKWVLWPLLWRHPQANWNNLLIYNKLLFGRPQGATQPILNCDSIDPNYGYNVKPNNIFFPPDVLYLWDTASKSLVLPGTSDITGSPKTYQTKLRFQEDRPTENTLKLLTLLFCSWTFWIGFELSTFFCLSLKMENILTRSFFLKHLTQKR